MNFFRARVPAQVRELAAGERVLAHTTSEAGLIVATMQALHLPGGVRLEWRHIDKASWDEAGVNVTTTDGARYQAAVPDPGLLPEVVRERVTNTIVASRHVRLSTRGGVRLVARRTSGTTDVNWDLIFDPGLDPKDPGVRAAAEQALEEVRRNLGV